MKKHILAYAIFLGLGITQLAFSQNHKNLKKNTISTKTFDEKTAIEDAKAKGIKPSDINGYVQFLKHDFASKKALKNMPHKHTPFENAKNISETVIYLQPNQPLSAGCPNMGFENYDFSGWSGSTGTVTTGANLPNYNSVGTNIVNVGGNNISLVNSLNYHTIMTLPPVSPIYPNCLGYDSLACKAIGTQTISQIPVVSPFSFDPVSVRMNGALSDYRACRLKYITTTSSTNKQITFSYAVVLQSPNHQPGETPYFKVEVKNEATNTILPGCTSYTFNPETSVPSDSLFESVIGSTFEPTFYRKWQVYSVDLSTLPLGTNVSINFEVGGCSLSGHWGYAYVDAECGGIGVPTANMCVGTNFATLVAPPGFISYQWLDPLGAVIPGETNDTLIVNSATLGTVYSVQMVSPGACTLTLTDTIKFSSISIANINSSSSCPGGSSGSANVQAIGSNGIYNYVWTATSGPNIGSVVSTSQTATGLPPGSYSVLVSSSSCGQASANVSVGTAPPAFYVQSIEFCHANTYIPIVGGSNHQWYKGTTLIPGPIGTNDSLLIPSPVNGDDYTLVYTNQYGCKDSLKYILDERDFFFFKVQEYCGSVASIANSGGSNYVWYHGNTIIPGPIGTNDTLFISSPINGDIYSLVYTNSTGCKDSIEYVLDLTSGGSVFFSNIQNVCPGNTNGMAVINLNTSFAAPFSYFVTGPNGVVTSTTSSSTTYTLNGLAAGSYSATIYDGFCTYLNTFTVNPIQTNFSIIPTSTVLCFPTDTAILNLDFSGNSSLCGTDPILCSGNTPITLFSSGPFDQNSASNYPTPYGNYYTYGRTQFLVRKAELNAAGITAGRISSLAFNVLDMNSSISNYPNFSISMGCTNLSDLPNVTSGAGQSFITTGMQNVYSNSSEPVALGWTTHNFNQSYIWDGNSNLIVEVCFSENSPSTYIDNVSIELKQMPYIASMYHVEDDNPVCGGSQQADNGDGSTMQNGPNMLPNMKFGYCSYSSPIANFTVSVSSNGTLVHNYGNDSLKVVPTFTSPPSPNAPVIYTVTVVNPIGGCVTTETVAILYPTQNTFLTTTPLNPTVCAGTQVSLSAFGAVNYNWYYLQSGSQIPIANTQGVSVTPPFVGANSYIVTGSAPCPGVIPDTKTVTVYVQPKANLLITPLFDVTKCLNQPFIINTGVGSTTPGNLGVPYSYSWSTLPGNVAAPGTNNASSYTVTSNATTTLVVTVDGVCATTAKDTVVIKNYVNNLDVSIPDAPLVCPNKPFTIQPLVTGGYPDYQYAWYLGTSSTPISTNANLSYTGPGTEGVYNIALVVSDSCQYNDAAYQVITVLPPCDLVIPNIITPNGDGANEYFKLKNIEFHPNTNLIIYDRWGVKVYENPNYNNDWKGDGVSDGTFFYVIEDTTDDKKFNGFITVYHGK